VASRVSTGTYLDKILDNTIQEIAQRKRQLSFADLAYIARERVRKHVSLAGALQTREVGIIAEIKRASPSKGPIASDIVATDVARDYLAGGCAGISVLTDGKFFGGSLDDLHEVSTVAHSDTIPRSVLRKDFIVDPYQIIEACSAGADAVLLIVAALEDSQLKELADAAGRYGIETLIEVHDEDELARALKIRGALIGINNRDLRSFNVDLATTERIAPLVPDGVTIIGESGIRTREDVERMQSAGVHAVLVGETLMRHTNRQQALAELLR
jgi:indole-3-glycerol phosphate synthase